MNAGGRLLQNRGFTLVELLVAIGVLGISMTLVLGIYSSVFSVVERVDQTSSFQNRSALLVDQLQRDLFGIYKGKSGFFRADIEPNPAVGAPILELTTSSQLRFKSADQPASMSVVRYSLDRPTNNSTFNLYRSEIPLLSVAGKSSGDAALAMVVCEYVVAVRLSFKDRYGALLDQWQARSSVMKDGPDDDRFPQLVRMELELADGAETGAETKTVSISIAIPAAQFITKSRSGEGRDE